MNYYPEQLRGIADMIEALNGLAKVETASNVQIKSRVPVEDPRDAPLILGYLVDEIGGAWSFEPVGGAE